MAAYKVLTLTQPWATLIAVGAKRIETRSWHTSYRGAMLIHAAAGLGPVGGVRGLYDLCETEPFHSALRGENLPHVLPKGAIVAACELVDCVPTEYIRLVKIIRPVQKPGYQWLWTENEKAFGDYSPGRFAWLLADIRALPEPIPAKGKLGLWTWEGELPPIP